MAMTREAQGIRKGVLVTMSIAVVLAASGATEVNWIISLKGIWAWLFVFLAHGYFSIMWYFHRKIFDDSVPVANMFFCDGQVENKNTAKSEGRKVDAYFLSNVDGVLARQWMARRFTDAAVFLGLLIAGVNLILRGLRDLGFQI